ncbi:MAG: YggS family pyridoxal phosphate-dependent enzyme [Acidimicrobiia bacterium]
MTLGTVRERIATAVERSGRRPGDVRLVAVTKERTADEIRCLYEQGQRDFGENRAQELQAKVPALPADIRWHFIGPLQRNKVRVVRPAVVLLHSLDRVTLAEAWIKGPGLPPPALLQVNIGREPQKHGVMPEEAVGTAEQMLAMGVRVAGVMAIPPVVETAELARPYFVELRRIRDRVAALEPAAGELSMGMTDDFEVAVEEGATLIRVGRAIFAP